MATDTSLVVYRCPFCPEFFRDSDTARRHISGRSDEKHRNKSGFELDHPLETLVPDIPEFDFDLWADDLEWYAEENTEGDGLRVPYKDAAEYADCPEPFAVWYYHTKTDYVPAQSDGRRAGNSVPYEWGDIADGAQNVVITKAYYPNVTGTEMVEEFRGMPSYNPEVYRAINRYMWMLAHPDVDTPVYPVEEDEPEENDVRLESGDVYEMLEEWTDEKGVDLTDEEVEEEMHAVDEEELLEDDETECGECGEKECICPDDESVAWEEDGDYAETAAAGMGESEPARMSGDARVSTSSGVAFTEPDLTFESIAALIETNRYEEARRLFDRATGAEEYDLRWEAPEADVDG